jgi:hypothetical protein
MSENLRKFPIYFAFLALPADRFFAFGLRGRQAVTCEPHQAAWGPRNVTFLSQNRLAFAV